MEQIAKQDYDLADPNEFMAACAELGRIATNVTLAVDGIHCPSCGNKRRVDMFILFARWEQTQETQRGGNMHPARITTTCIPNPPVLAALTCRQCHMIANALGFTGPSGNDLVVTWPTPGGLTTPATPAPVAYYLDQAARSEAAGARSAATAMYRAALEQLLFEQGYQAGMLNAKIVALEADIAAGKGKKWATDLDPSFLRVIKDLGNGSIHPNGGDVKKQAALDTQLVREMRATMLELLDLVYEEPKRRAQRLATLQSAASIVK